MNLGNWRSVNNSVHPWDRPRHKTERSMHLSICPICMKNLMEIILSGTPPPLRQDMLPELEKNNRLLEMTHRTWVALLPSTYRCAVFSWRAVGAVCRAWHQVVLADWTRCTGARRHLLSGTAHTGAKSCDNHLTIGTTHASVL